MKQYKQLTTEQRYQIYGLKQSGLNQTQIALNVGVDKSTISREFRRNRGKRGWRLNRYAMNVSMPVIMASTSL